MRGRTATLAAVALAAVAVALALIFGGTRRSETGSRPKKRCPAQPTVEIISPRNGARQASHAVVVKVEVENFQLAPRPLRRRTATRPGPHPLQPQPGPRLRRPGETAARDRQPARQRAPRRRLLRLPRATRAPTGPRRADRHRRQLLPRHPAGDLLPRPHARLLPPDRQPGPEQRHDEPFHDVTNFQILPRHNNGPKPCPPGKVPSAKAAQRLDNTSRLNPRSARLFEPILHFV